MIILAWGYEKCFVIEHDNTLKRRIDCKDCCNYDFGDKSCMKRPLYLPVDGYNSWRTCKYFELNPETSHYEEKKTQYASVLRRKTNDNKNNNSIVKNVKKIKGNSMTQSQDRQVITPKAIIVNDATSVRRSGYRICMIEEKPKGKKLKYEYIEIVTASGGKRKIQVGFDDVEKVAYINKKVYTKEAIDSVRKILK